MPRYNLFGNLGFNSRSNSIPKGHIISNIVKCLIIVFMISAIGKNTYLFGNVHTNVNKILIKKRV